MWKQMALLLSLTLWFLIACRPSAEKNGHTTLSEAQEGNAKAQMKTALRYDQEGQYEAAAAWYRKAAEQGHNGAIEALKGF